MDVTLEFLLLLGLAAICGGFAVVFAVGVIRKIRAKPQPRRDWLTRNQLLTLQGIGKNGRSGIPLWNTDIKLSTIRSLAKRGFVASRSQFEVVITRAGKARLCEPWPPIQPTGDQKDVINPLRSGNEEIDSAASHEARESRWPRIEGSLDK